MSYTLKLSKRIKVTGKAGIEELSEIEFRDPTAGDFFDLGLPIRIVTREDGGQEVTPIGPAMRDWATRLSGRSGADIGALSVGDVQRFSMWLNKELAPQGNSE